MILDINAFVNEFTTLTGTTIPQDGVLSVTSFVVNPQGCMTPGKTSTVNLQRATIPLSFELENLTLDVELPIDYAFLSQTVILFQDMIALCDPCYGTYHFGLQIEYNNLPTLSASIITGQVKSSKTQTTTAIPIEIPISVGLAGLTFTQCTAQFNYAPAQGIPSEPVFAQ